MVVLSSLKRIEIMADNNYTLRYSGSIEEIKAKGYNLESALDRKGIIFNSIQQDNSRNPNGKYIVHLSGGGRMYATWLEKKVLRM